MFTLPATPGLREQRLRVALTQAELAERLTRLAWVREQRQVRANSDMVSKWERGIKRPSLRYQRLLRVALDPDLAGTLRFSGRAPRATGKAVTPV